jgi:hypothetical protein
MTSLLLAAALALSPPADRPARHVTVTGSADQPRVHARVGDVIRFQLAHRHAWRNAPSSGPARVVPGLTGGPEPVGTGFPGLRFTRGGPDRDVNDCEFVALEPGLYVFSARAIRTGKHPDNWGWDTARFRYFAVEVE